MKSLYLLNNHIYFDPVSGQLSPSPCFSSKVALSKPASHCLKLLISKQGEICCYPYLSHQIWGERGKWMSNNTIHQHIYQLRHRLKKAGIEKEMIITVPRKGFQLCPSVAVLPVDLLNHESGSNIAPSVEQRMLSGVTLSSWILYTLIIMNGLLTLILVAMIIG